MHLMYFTEQPMSAYPEQAGRDFGATALMFSNTHFDPVAGLAALQRLHRAIHAGRGGRRRRHHAERAPQRAVLHAGQGQHLRRHPRRHDQEGEDRHAGQSAAAGGEPDPARRRAGDDRHDLQGPAGLGLRARRRPGAARHRRQPGLQPRALRGGARPDRQGLDAARPVPLRGHALPAPRGEPVGGAAAEALSARLDPRRDQQGDDHLGGAAALSLHRAQHLDRADQEDLGALRPASRPRSAMSAGRRTAAT